MRKVSLVLLGAMLGASAVTIGSHTDLLAAGAKAAMVQPFTQDHGAGAQQGALRGIGLVQTGVFGGAGRFLHEMSLARIAVRMV